MTDRKQQSVELLKLLGEDTAEAVLAHLPAEYAAEIRSQIQGDPALGMRTKQKLALLDDFECFFDFALKSSPRNLNVFDYEAAAQQDKEAEESTTEPTELPANRHCSSSGIWPGSIIRNILLKSPVLMRTLSPDWPKESGPQHP